MDPEGQRQRRGAVVTTADATCKQHEGPAAARASAEHVYVH